MTLVLVLLVALLLIAVTVLALEWYWWEAHDDGGGAAMNGPAIAMSALATSSFVVSTCVLAATMKVLSEFVEWPYREPEAQPEDYVHTHSYRASTIITRVPPGAPPGPS